MAIDRLRWRRGDGSAVVRGWVWIYTLGLPGAMRGRRRLEVAGDLADEALDAVRRGSTAGLRRRRLFRWALGLPDDVLWRVTDARDAARRYRTDEAWTPPNRWSLSLLAMVAIGTSGGFALVAVPYVVGPTEPALWPGWGPAGFLIAAGIELIAIVVAVPWPRRGVVLATLGACIGFAATPWLWGCWAMCVLAVSVRWYQARLDGRTS
jgi:hypothetical protein